MSNIINKAFIRKLKSLNDDNNIIPYILDKPKKLKKFSSIIVTPLLKHKLNIDYSLENNKDFNKVKNINDNKHSLFLKKINLKEKKNKYYMEGIQKLFNDESIFLDNNYKGKKIVVGKSRNKSNINISIRNNNKNSSKKIKPKSKNVSLNNATLFNKSNNYQINNNTFVNDSFMQNTKGRKIIWSGGKRNDNYISDDELKSFYQECMNREKVSLNETQKKSKNKIFIHNENKSPSIKECNNIINLQSLVLNKYKLRNIETKKMINRLLRLTSKKKDNLLINKMNDYRITKEKKDEEEINNIIYNNPNLKDNNIKEFETKIQWLSSLREYESDGKKNNKKKRCISSNNNELISSQKYYSPFNKKDIRYDLSGKFYPLFAQVTPIINKEGEIIRDTLNDLKIQKRNSINNNIIKMNNILINNKKSKINLYKGLNIKGKKLLNFEIEISKELEGKKKKIVQYPYRDEEISTKLFAKSYSVNNFFVPKSVKNTIELHYNQE